MRIYGASSWRNLIQPGIVHVLRRIGHEVYDFRNPPNKSGFGWGQVNPNWKRTESGLASEGKVEPQVWREMLRHPIAERGYAADKSAIEWCDTILYVLPCGKSASWELGYATAKGKRSFVLALEPCEPELMFLASGILVSMDEVFEVFGEPKEDEAA